MSVGSTEFGLDRVNIAFVINRNQVARGVPLITVDHKGNVYAVQAELSGADGHSGGAGAYKFTFKGYSPKVSCPPCVSTRRIE